MPIGTKDVPSQYPTFEPGSVHEVKFKEWFPTDSEGVPYLVPQQRFGEETLVIRYRTQIGDEDGPAASIDPMKELPLLVQTYGGDPTELPELQLKNMGQILLIAATLMKGTATVTVNDSGTWIGSTEGMTVPKGSYLLSWGRVTSFNTEGRPSWIPGQYGPLVYGRFEIAAGKFAGTEVPFFLPYDFVIDEETMEPCFKRTEKTGQLTAGSQKMQNMILSYFGDPAEFRHELCEDIYNIIPELVTEFEKAKKVASGQVNERGAADLKTLSPPAEGLVPEKAVKPTPKAKAEISVPPKKEAEPKPKAAEPDLAAAQNVLRNVVSVEVKNIYGDDAVAWEDEKDWILTETGKDWAGKDLAGLVDGLGIGRYFKEYTLEHIKQILEGLGYDIVGIIGETTPKAEEDEPPF